MKFITTPIYYVNDKPHIGHYYCSIISDILIRLNFLSGNSVEFLTGTDEHGQKIQKASEEKKISCKKYTDDISIYFKKISCDFNLSFAKDSLLKENFFIKDEYLPNKKFENFIRTSSDFHKNFVQKIWLQMIENKWIYKGKYSGFYSIRDESFYKENEILNGLTIETNTPVVFIEHDCYFFKLTAFQDFFTTFYKKNPQLIQPEIKVNEILAYLNNLDKIGDLPISRPKKITQESQEFFWGIEVPNDKSHLIYVWVDALFNYLSHIYQKNNENYFSLWKEKQTMHIIGKEILKFHAIYWPSFLIATQYNQKEFEIQKKNEQKIKEIFFKKIIVHGWWLNNGEKISKSSGNIININEEITWLKTNFNIDEEIAIDYLKFFLATKFKIESDMNYSKESLVEYINAKLINNIGNCLNRILSIAKKINFKYKNSECKKEKNFQEENLKLIEKNDIYTIFQNIDNLFSNLNRDIDFKKPWELLKKQENTQELEKFLFECINEQLIGIYLLSSICVNITKNICDALNLDLTDLENIFLNKKPYDLQKINLDKIKIFFPNLKIK